MLRCTLVALSCLFFLSCAENSKQQEGSSSNDTAEIPDPGNAEEEVSMPDTAPTDTGADEESPTPDTVAPNTSKERPPIKAEYKTFVND
jgi:hypothetical protein